MVTIAQPSATIDINFTYDDIFCSFDSLAISTKEAGDGVKITCTNSEIWHKDDAFYRNASELELQYSDDNSGEYSCVKGEIKHNILVKFRTCDNCIALDTGTVVGIIVGEVVATLLIGWAVYLLASQPQGKVFNQANKASDRQNLIQNQQNDSTYQQLSHGNSSEYSHLEPRRGRKH
ncbi:T-cell surface glycoprotein CD3 delta chain-like [Conger conger]|uniref:T-cell surface glycoprotein CD3 delta chain-like n=1 Tax=Conger conger TaxID=82655 RepID=UPI002A5AB870|nr:T-cell surface glycoprotein CD3 delta chain-like [Conger conger]